MNKQEFILRIYNKRYVDKFVGRVKLLGIGDKTSAYSLIVNRLISSAAIFILLLFNFFFV